MVRTLQFGITYCTDFLFKEKIENFEKQEVLGPIHCLMDFKNARLWIIMSFTDEKDDSDEEILKDLLEYFNQWGKMNLISTIPQALHHDEGWQTFILP